MEQQNCVRLTNGCIQPYSFIVSGRKITISLLVNERDKELNKLTNSIISTYSNNCYSHVWDAGNWMQLNFDRMNTCIVEVLHSITLQHLLKHCKPRTCLFPIYVKKEYTKNTTTHSSPSSNLRETRRPLISITNAFGSVRAHDVSL